MSTHSRGPRWPFIVAMATALGLAVTSAIAGDLSNALYPDAQSGSFPVQDANGTYAYSTTAGDLKVCKDSTLAECSEINADVGTFFCSAPISDVATDACIDGGRDAYPISTGANQVGGNRYRKAGIGMRAFTGVTAAGCAAGHQNVTMTVITPTAAGTTSTVTTCTEAGTWSACGGTNNACATGLGACLAAATGVGITVQTNNVYITPASGTLNVTLTSSADPDCATKVQAANGAIYDYGAVTTSGLLTCTASSSGCTELSQDLTPQLGGDLDLQGFDVYGKAVNTTDTAADASSISCGQSQYWGAAPTAGGACYLGGGVGVRKVAVVAAAIENDTLVIAGIKGGVATSATWTYNAGGIGTCAALTNSQCAVLLVNYCNTNGPALGIASCACADATCTVATVGFVPSVDTIALKLTASDASQTVTMGSDGQIALSGGGTAAGASSGVPAYIGTTSTGNLCVFSGTTPAACAYPGGGTTPGFSGGPTGTLPLSFYGTQYTFNAASGGMQLLTGGVLSLSTDASRAKLSSPADNETQQTGSAATTGFRLNSSVDNKLLITGRTNNTTAALLYSYPKTITTADDAGGTHAATTINPADANTVLLACNDTDGCTATITETAAVLGMQVELLCNGTGPHTDFADSAGVLELAGGAAFVCAPMMSIDLRYNGTAWLEHSRSGSL